MKGCGVGRAPRGNEVAGEQEEGADPSPAGSCEREMEGTEGIDVAASVSQIGAK